MRNKKILVVGAGNAGRPAAKLLHHLGNEVLVTEIKEFEKLPLKAKKRIKKMQESGIRFHFGGHHPQDIEWADAIFISPNIPKDSVIYKLIEKKDIEYITPSMIGSMLNSLIKIPMVGVAGTDGKTTTTNMIKHILKGKHATISFSSLEDSLVIEGLVDLLVEDKLEGEFAVFELPHGTIRMTQGLELCAGIITTLTPDHLDEFKDYDDYIRRNLLIKDLINERGLLILNGDDPIIGGFIDEIDARIIYGLGRKRLVEFHGRKYVTRPLSVDVKAEEIKLKGLRGSEFTFLSGRIPTVLCERCGSINCECGDFKREYVGPYEERINLQVPGIFNVENALAAITTGLILGFDIDYLKERIGEFKGIRGRFEVMGVVDGVKVYMDAAHNPESMEKLFEGLEFDGGLIISLDNPDTLTVRDKFKIGKTLAKAADLLIVSAKNETTGQIDWKAAEEVAEGANPTKTIIVENVYKSIKEALKNSEKGNIIIHMGPGVVNAYQNVKMDIRRAIEDYKGNR
ncbi:MAG: Mur ligase family protein [Methanobacteriales archaeon]